MEGVEPQPSFEVFKPSKLQVPVNKPEYENEFSFSFEMASRLIQEMES
jgi:hypothetical protein